MKDLQSELAAERVQAAGRLAAVEGELRTEREDGAATLILTVTLTPTPIPNHSPHPNP